MHSNTNAMIGTTGH